MGRLQSLTRWPWATRSIVTSFGRQYVYEVKSVGNVAPDDISVFKHDEQAGADAGDVLEVQRRRPRPTTAAWWSERSWCR